MVGGDTSAGHAKAGGELKHTCCSVVGKLRPGGHRWPRQLLNLAPQSLRNHFSVGLGLVSRTAGPVVKISNLLWPFRLRRSSSRRRRGRIELFAAGVWNVEEDQPRKHSCASVFSAPTAEISRVDPAPVRFPRKRFIS